jgi:deazaflavin-dependent oxidoreductase (nitroreductase family)
MPDDRLLKAANVAHRALITVSRGRIGWRAAKMPVLRLTTIGRRSGRRRAVMLTSPHQEGDDLVIVASRGGDDRHPAWFVNLRHHPEVEVETQDEPRHTRTARIAGPEERARLWPLITAKHANYAGYQRKTDREIPLVVLERRTG